MSEHSIYKDIAERTGGDIYIGVVGPVRSGKSTFITRFMQELVLPNMKAEAVRERARDEMPQSAAGRTVMTTEPKFVPDEGVSLTLDEGVSMRVKMIDCVGYMIPEAMGGEERDAFLQLLDNLFHLQKGIIGTVIHITSADQVDHRHITEAGIIHTPTASRRLGGIVGRPQNPGIFL